MVDVIEEPLVRPVDVLEREDERVSSREPLQETSPGVEEFFAAKRPWVARPDQRCDLRHEVPLAEQLPDGRLSLLEGDIGRVVFEDLALGLDHIRQRRVRRVAVREAPPAPPVHELGQAFDVALELPDQSRFADTGRSDDRNERRTTLALYPSERLLQNGELLVATDQLRLHAELRALPSLLGSDPLRLPRRDRVCLALEVEPSGAPGTRSRLWSRRRRPGPRSRGPDPRRTAAGPRCSPRHR